MKKVIALSILSLSLMTISCNENAAKKIKSENLELAKERDEEIKVGGAKVKFDKTEHDFGVINEGVIIEIATPDTLGGRNTAPAKVTWLENGATQELLTKNPTEEVLKLSQRFNNQIPELQVLRPNLEEIYLRMIGELK